MAVKSPEAKERALARARAWKARNAERCKELRRAYRLANKERENENNRRWQEANPEKVRALRAKRAQYFRDWQCMRKSERTGLPAMFNPQDVRDLYGGRCWACGSSERIGMDHIIPLKRGGVNYAYNVRLLCAGCNLRKFKKLDHEIAYPEFRQRLLLGADAMEVIS